MSRVRLKPMSQVRLKPDTTAMRHEIATTDRWPRLPTDDSDCSLLHPAISSEGMFRMPGARAVMVAMALAGGASAADAQSTRVEELDRQRAQKSSQLRPYEPGRLERFLLYVEREQPLKKLNPENGFFVRYGYTERPVGAGIGFGGGYRHDLFNRTARAELEGGITFQNYNLLRADLSFPYFAQDRIEVGIEGSWRHHPREDFYGEGTDSHEGDRVSYLFKGPRVVGRAIAHPKEWLATGLRVGWISPTIDAGTDTRFPSIEDRFTDRDTPGLDAQPDFRYMDLFAAVDYRDQSRNARAGGYYAVTWRSYADLDLDRYDFRRVDVQLQQFLPVFDKKRVFALQAVVMSSTADDGQQVPFYFQPTLGGSTTVRGYADYRFRDDKVMHLNAEYRWEAFSGLDMALFSDWGKVASAGEALDFSDLKHGYGIGFRFNTYRNVFFRFDIGTGGGEGFHYFVKYSRVF